jgi:hypothetical protein
LKRSAIFPLLASNLTTGSTSGTGARHYERIVAPPINERLETLP